MNIIVMDTETANEIDCPLAYDIGWAVLDLDTFEVVKTESFVNADIYIGEKELMKSAYFAEKIPLYEADLKTGKRKLRTLNTIHKIFYKDCKKYNVQAISAHNARFDYKAVNLVRRWITKSEYRYFIPYGIEIWDTLKMAQQVFYYDEDYRNFCREYDMMVSPNRPRMTAEALFRYISNDPSFEEAHTGLEDVLIEKEILRECLLRKPDLEKRLWVD